MPFYGLIYHAPNIPKIAHLEISLSQSLLSPYIYTAAKLTYDYILHH